MFITFEGPEGSGKTTQIALLTDHIRQQGFDLCVTREPGGTEIGEEIREVLHSLDNRAMTPEAEILLYSASRAQHVGEVIRPALERGAVVVSDRFYDSTYAYQGYGHGLDLAMLHEITEFATGGLTPDLTIYLDIDPKHGLSRRRGDDTGEWNRLDEMKLAFHRKVYAGYQKLIKAEPDRWLRIDGDRPVDVVQSDIQQQVMNRLTAE